jgi:hypothetical protein
LRRAGARRFFGAAAGVGCSTGVSVSVTFHLREDVDSKSQA